MSSSGDLALYELQRPIVEPFLRMFRLTNAALDFLISDLTFGCAIAEELRDCRYTQALGLLDGLGTLNSWGHQPEQRPLGHHSTNSFTSFSSPVATLAESAASSSR
jgi:hypothetical protein